MPSSQGRRTDFESEALPHASALYRAALGLTAEASAAEDLVQETFHRAWRSFDSYQLGTNCRAWLFRILFRVRGELMQKGGRLQWTRIDALPEDRLASPPDAERRIARTDILKIVDSLPEHYRTVLVLADAEQFTYQEIADMLEVPIGTVMSRLNRSRRLFRERYLGSGKQA